MLTCVAGLMIMTAFNANSQKPVKPYKVIPKKITQSG